MGFKNSFITTTNPEDTYKLGLHFAQVLPPKAVVAFFGDLAAGKTTFIKGLATAITGAFEESFSSPTFNYLNIYEGRRPLYHFDLYRLADSKQFQEMGFDEYFDEEGVCCIEWAERIESILPENTISISIKHIGDNQREITIMPLYEKTAR